MINEEGYFDRWLDVVEIGKDLHDFHTQLAMQSYPEYLNEAWESDESNDFPISFQFDKVMDRHTHIVGYSEIFIEGLDKTEPNDA